MNLQRAIPGLAMAAALIAAAPAQADLVLPRISPNATVTQTVGITDLSVKYSRPGVKGRKIWGELVPMSKPWRTGANEATNFTTTDEITIGDKKLPAGAYALFTIPTENEWTVIFSKQKDLWGSTDYDPAQDALRYTAKPQPADAVEWMRFSFDNLTPTSTDLVLRWEKLQLAVPIAVDVHGIVMAKARTELANAKADDWRTRYRVAQYLYDSNKELTEAAKLLDESIAIQAGYSNLGLRARWLAKDGKKKDAAAVATKAIAAGKAAKPPADTTTLEKELAGWDD
jgi:hypothetical protein